MTVPDDLSGLLAPGIGPALYGLAALVPADHAIVEVGSFRGKSTAYLAAGAIAGAGPRVHAVDPWDLPGNPHGKHGFGDPQVRQDFEAQLCAAGLRDQVTAWQAFSTVAASQWDGPPIGLLFIDGDHTETAVRTDVDAWSPHLARHHVLAFDDYDTRPNPGVRSVVDGLAGYDVRIVADHLAVCTPVL